MAEQKRVEDVMEALVDITGHGVTVYRSPGGTWTVALGQDVPPSSIAAKGEPDVYAALDNVVMLQARVLRSQYDKALAETDKTAGKLAALESLTKKGGQ